MTASERPSTTGGPVEIRRAVRADLLDVLRIERASFPQPWPYSVFASEVGGVGFLVADADAARSGPMLDGPVVGYAVAGWTPDRGPPHGHLKNLAVRPDWRGRGVGSTLLARALDTLDANGAVDVKLEVRPSNDAARTLYADVGFEHRRTVPGYYADGEDAFVYVMPLGDGR